jgi:SAM-dependent methyltransferase
MTYCFDIDGTLCTHTNGAYELAEPHTEVIARANSLYDSGHRIILFTARGTTTGINWRELTEKQLLSWGVKYHELLFGKPEADIFVDDRAMGPTSWDKLGITIASSQENLKAEPPPVFTKARYLEVTYDPERAPKGPYPFQLAGWLLKNVYKKPGRLLDLGCGRGDHLEAFGRLGFEVSGVDLAPQTPQLSVAATVKAADIERDPLPFPPGSFDFVFSKSVIEHMRHPTRLLSRALEALKPEGLAVIMTPSWAHTYWGPFYVDHTHVTPFTAPSLAEALAIAGFESVEVTNFCQLPILWQYPFLKPILWTLAKLPLPYRPFAAAPWPEGVNKLIRFSKEIMLLGVGRKSNRDPEEALPRQL